MSQIFEQALMEKIEREPAYERMVANFGLKRSARARTKEMEAEPNFWVQ